MDAIDRYIECLGDPELRAFNRKIHGFNEGDPEPEGWDVTEAHIAAAEEALGVSLPPSYRKLVLTAQPHDAEYGLYWVWDGGTFRGTDDIVTVHQAESNRLPPFLIGVVGTDDGDAYCFDTRRVDERGEYPIVHFDHEIHHEGSVDFETVAVNLGEYLLASV